MANRHLSRSIVLQTLFEWDFHHKSVPSITAILARNSAEFADDGGDQAYMENLLAGVLKNLDSIDLVIEKAAPDWPLEKIATVDRNILRLGLFELLYGDHEDAPPKVAINEAIELGKAFGGESSGRFINGVLGSVYRELGEPGKDQSSGKIKNIPYAKMPLNILVGSVIYSDNDGKINIALVHDVFGRWTLPKGRVLEEESETDALIRVAEVDLGIEITPKELLGENEYIANDPESGKVRKKVNYYLAEAPYQQLTAGESDGITEVRWFTLPEVVALRFYKDVLPIVTDAAERILKGSN
jgi:N utilization substance protein B